MAIYHEEYSCDIVMSMNICILAPENSPSEGGVGAYVFNLIKNLPLSNEIHIVTVNRSMDDSFDKLFSNNSHIFIHKIMDVSENDWFFYNFKFQMSVFRQLKRLDSNYNFDIIHSHSGHLPHLFSQFQKIAPLVVTVHATIRGLKKSLDQYQTAENKEEKWMKIFSQGICYCEKISFLKARLLMPVSKFTLRQIIEYYNYINTGKACIIYNAVDPSIFEYRKKCKTREPTLLFVGRLYGIKGIDVFIDAIRKLLSKGLKFNVKIVGRGNSERIESELSKILPRNKYQITGQLNYFKMSEVYKTSDILVVSSIYENCPTTILEAMSIGTLIVASDIGGIPEIIRDGYNGFLFENGNSVQLAKILEKLISGKEDVDDMLKTANLIVRKKHNWHLRGPEIYRVYEEVIE